MTQGWTRGERIVQTGKASDINSYTAEVRQRDGPGAGKEEVGIGGGRGAFIDGVGQVRDRVQSYPLQVLARTMLDPAHTDADDAWRWESPARHIAGRLCDAVGGTMVTPRWSHASVPCPRGCGALTPEFGVH